VSRSGVEELASSGGGHVTQEPDGMATIDFAGPGTPYIPPFSTTPVTVSRLGLGDLSSAASSATSGLRDRATSAAHDMGGHALDQAQQLGDQAIGQATNVAHGAIDHAAAAAHEALGGGESPEDAKAKADEMYEHVLQRLRRDLIGELEASGQLLRDNT
jgi:hypothetical protein